MACQMEFPNERQPPRRRREQTDGFGELGESIIRRISSRLPQKSVVSNVDSQSLAFICVRGNRPKSWVTRVLRAGMASMAHSEHFCCQNSQWPDAGIRCGECAKTRERRASERVSGDVCRYSLFPVSSSAIRFVLMFVDCRYVADSCCPGRGGAEQPLGLKAQRFADQPIGPGARVIRLAWGR
jgi:hypothetical protein